MESIIIDNNESEKPTNGLQMKEDLSAKPRHLIQVVNRRTGLSSDVIRVWRRGIKQLSLIEMIPTEDYILTKI